MRKIIHIDMDAFFAAVEQRDFPEYQNYPIVVGGSPQSRGVVATCSYEARKFGIHSAMPCSHAYRLCPKAIFVKPRFDAYKEASQIIRKIFHEYSDKVEPLSIDEAYLEVTDSELHQGSATLIAQEIRQKIYQETQLTASAGISYNKFLAKIASDINKPNGQFVITPKNGERFIAQLPIGKFYGIGKVTEKKMTSLGIHNGADLRNWHKEQLESYFGKAGSYYYSIARGVDNRKVGEPTQQKSIGTETTFAYDLSDYEEMEQVIHKLCIKVAKQLKATNTKALTITIKVKFSDFKQVTRSFTNHSLLDQPRNIFQIAQVLLKRAEINNKKVRLLGVTASQIHHANQAARPIQLSLFD